MRSPSGSVPERSAVPGSAAGHGRTPGPRPDGRSPVLSSQHGLQRVHVLLRRCPRCVLFLLLLMLNLPPTDTTLDYQRSVVHVLRPQKVPLKKSVFVRSILNNPRDKVNPSICGSESTRFVITWGEKVESILSKSSSCLLLLFTYGLLAIFHLLLHTHIHIPTATAVASVRDAGDIQVQPPCERCGRARRFAEIGSFRTNKRVLFSENVYVLPTPYACLFSGRSFEFKNFLGGDFW